MARRMSRIKKTVIGLGVFLLGTVVLPIVAWSVFGLEGTQLAKVLGFVVFGGLCVGGWLAWTQITRAFFEG